MIADALGVKLSEMLDEEGKINCHYELRIFGSAPRLVRDSETAQPAPAYRLTHFALAQWFSL